MHRHSMRNFESNMVKRTVKGFTRSEFLSLLDSKESKKPPESFGKLPESYQKMAGVDYNELFEQMKQGSGTKTAEPTTASQELDKSSLGDFKNDEGIMKLADNLASVLLAELKGKDSYLPVSFIENAYKKMYGTNLAEECEQNGFSSTVQFLGAHPKYFKNRGNQWSAIVGEAEKYNVADMLGSKTGTEKRYQRNINWHQNLNKTHIGFFGNTSMNRPLTNTNMNATMSAGYNTQPLVYRNPPIVPNVFPVPLFPSSAIPAFRPTKFRPPPQFRPPLNGESSFDPFVYPNEQKETYLSRLRRSRSQANMQEIGHHRSRSPNRNNDSRGLDEERFHSENGRHNNELQKQNPNKTHSGIAVNTSMNRPLTNTNMNATMSATYKSILRRSRSQANMQEIGNYRSRSPDRDNGSRGLDEERFHSENGRHFENKPPQLRSVTPVEHRPPVPHSPEPAKVTDSKAGIDNTKKTEKKGKIDEEMAIMLLDIMRNKNYEVETSMAVTMLEARTKKFKLAPNGDCAYLKELKEKVPTLLEVLRFKQKKVNGVLVDYVFIDTGDETSDEDNRDDAHEEPELLTSILSQPSLSYAQRRTSTTHELRLSNNGELIIQTDDDLIEAVEYLLSKKPEFTIDEFLEKVLFEKNTSYKELINKVYIVVERNMPLTGVHIEGATGDSLIKSMENARTSHSQQQDPEESQQTEYSNLTFLTSSEHPIIKTAQNIRNLRESVCLAHFDQIDKSIYFRLAKEEMNYEKMGKELSYTNLRPISDDAWKHIEAAVSKTYHPAIIVKLNSKRERAIVKKIMPKEILVKLVDTGEEQIILYKDSYILPNSHITEPFAFAFKLDLNFSRVNDKKKRMMNESAKKCLRNIEKIELIVNRVEGTCLVGDLQLMDGISGDGMISFLERFRELFFK